MTTPSIATTVPQAIARAAAGYIRDTCGISANKIISQVIQDLEAAGNTLSEQDITNKLQTIKNKIKDESIKNRIDVLVEQLSEHDPLRAIESLERGEVPSPYLDRLKMLALPRLRHQAGQEPVDVAGVLAEAGDGVSIASALQSQEKRSLREFLSALLAALFKSAGWDAVNQTVTADLLRRLGTAAYNQGKTSDDVAILFASCDASMVDAEGKREPRDVLVESLEHQGHAALGATFSLGPLRQKLRQAIAGSRSERDKTLMIDAVLAGWSEGVMARDEQNASKIETRFATYRKQINAPMAADGALGQARVEEAFAAYGEQISAIFAMPAAQARGEAERLRQNIEGDLRLDRRDKKSLADKLKLAVVQAEAREEMERWPEEEEADQAAHEAEMKRVLDQAAVREEAERRAQLRAQLIALRDQVRNTGKEIAALKSSTQGQSCAVASGW